MDDEIYFIVDTLAAYTEKRKDGELLEAVFFECLCCSRDKAEPGDSRPFIERAMRCQKNACSLYGIGPAALRSIAQQARST